MWFAVILVLGTAGRAALPPPHKCTAAQVDACMRQYMDSDYDGMIDATEWNRFSLYGGCAPLIERVSGSSIIQACDRNGNGKLDLYDLTARGTCVSWGMWEHICDLCTNCPLYLAQQDEDT